MNSFSKNALDDSVQYLKSVGPKRAESFSKIGINTISDLLFYFPSRHLDRTTVLTAAKAYGYLMNGYDGELTVIGKVFDKEKKRFGRREILKVQFRDESGFFECVWFQGTKYFYSVFNEGDMFAVSSKPDKSKYGALQFIHPDFDRISEEEKNFLHTGKIIPFYRIPKELKSGNIGDLSLRRIISFAVDNYADFVEETLTEEIINQNRLILLKEAIRNYHFPESTDKLNSAKRRFKFEELFYLELLVALRKQNYQSKLIGNKLVIRTDLVRNFLKTLPFELTKAQLKVLGEIKSDLLSEKPMNRLLQGDVGSGKTIVSLIAMLIAVDNGFQAAIMAPTEILADQHAKNISVMMKRLCEQFPEREIKTSLLLGGQKKSERDKRLQEIELQETDIIIGTHALFEEKVYYKNLGLVVIDEQHRFGVRQRAKLQTKGKTPEVLVMSATPIPRTISMTIYGDLDISVIDEMPKNRKPIKTVLRGESKLPEIYKFIIDKKKDGYQTFIVYPLVEDSDKLELKAAESYYEELSQTHLKNLRLGLIHGRMSWQEKEEKMLLFLKKQFDVLVSTTVIEVGIDIPDANIILINDAHRFGLSQLHQLRGRVGRSDKQAFCILVTKDEIVQYNIQQRLDLDYISSSMIEKYKSAIRLQTMLKTNNGFEIAEADLKLRGPGDIFSTKQSGFPDLKYADIIQDAELISLTKQIAFNLINKDPSIDSPNNNIIRKNLIRHYSENLKYAKIA
ncbi:MAG: ATP-dependent DNA helicase RecG [Ignavibacteriota bacterium]|nr:MAG: ATP-dependent DNA helicase RecG [Chlorobiota bacterium]MBE7476159.1 ATP-dependent DNA helicase RecG [Ignavibacteriales bacterium]MBL1124150.1 ATP-dependent DNA helicase RecG [Ignavibacteriota bacterium]MEB2297181.1 ATP-dependent DNA helicase RecG [Ignavibacteria bacterium]QKJ96176.1 MAG: ATP-dependent DNA helicase RecG [Ignavibacteriota bacterium]